MHLDDNRLEAGSYNRVVIVHGPAGSGKTTLALDLLLASPGYHVVIAPRLPKIDGEVVRHQEVKKVSGLTSAIRSSPGAVAMVTEPGDTVERVIAVCKALVSSTQPRDKSSYVPATILLDEATRWDGISADKGSMSAAARDYFADRRHWGVGLILCTQTPRFLIERLFALATDLYSFRTISRLDIRRLEQCGEFDARDLSAELRGLDDHAWQHQPIGRKP